MGIIDFKNISVAYEDTNVFSDFSLSINPGELVTIIGPSGCGKTTLIRLVNRMVDFQNGEIFVRDRNILSFEKTELRRQTGYVIQQIGLMPHLTIEKNIGYVLKLLKKDANFISGRTRELIDLVGLDESFLERYPRELSGGQKQRIGVARALAADPDIILMDEPFGATDELTRKLLQDEIRKIHRDLRKTILFVTHDIEEAMKLGTQILLLNNGRIEQIGSREEMIFFPVNDYVKEFFGYKNFLAFLHIEPVCQVMQPVSINQKPVQENIPVVHKNSPIIEAVRKMFDSGHSSVMVANDTGDCEGIFSFDSINKDSLKM